MAAEDQAGQFMVAIGMDTSFAEKSMREFSSSSTSMLGRAYDKTFDKIADKFKGVSASLQTMSEKLISSFTDTSSRMFTQMLSKTESLKDNMFSTVSLMEENLSRFYDMAGKEMPIDTSLAFRTSLDWSALDIQKAMNELQKTYEARFGVSLDTKDLRKAITDLAKQDLSKSFVDQMKAGIMNPQEAQKVLRGMEDSFREFANNARDIVYSQLSSGVDALFSEISELPARFAAGGLEIFRDVRVSGAEALQRIVEDFKRTAVKMNLQVDDATVLKFIQSRLGNIDLHAKVLKPTDIRRLSADIVGGLEAEFTRSSGSYVSKFAEAIDKIQDMETKSFRKSEKQRIEGINKIADLYKLAFPDRPLPVAAEFEKTMIPLSTLQKGLENVARTYNEKFRFKFQSQVSVVEMQKQLQEFAKSEGIDVDVTLLPVNEAADLLKKFEDKMKVQFPESNLHRMQRTFTDFITKVTSPKTWKDLSDFTKKAATKDFWKNALTAEKVKEMFSSGGNLLLKGFSGLGNILKGAFTGVFAQFAGLLALGAIMTKIFGPAIEVMEFFLDEILAPIQALMVDLMMKLWPVFQAVGEVLTVFAEALMPLIDGILPIIVLLTKTLATVLVPVVKTVGFIFTALVEPLSKVLGTALKILWAPISMLISGIKTFFGMLFGAKEPTGFLGFFVKLVQFTNPVMWIIDAFRSFFRMLKGEPPVGIFASLSKIFKLFDPIKWLINAVQTLWHWITGHSPGLIPAVQALGEIFVKVFKVIGDVVIGIINAVVGGLVKAVEAFTKLVTTVNPVKLFAIAVGILAVAGSIGVLTLMAPGLFLIAAGFAVLAVVMPLLTKPFLALGFLVLSIARGVERVTKAFKTLYDGLSATKLFMVSIGLLFVAGALSILSFALPGIFLLVGAFALLSLVLPLLEKPFLALGKLLTVIFNGAEQMTNSFIKLYTTLEAGKLFAIAAGMLALSGAMILATASIPSIMLLAGAFGLLNLAMPRFDILAAGASSLMSTLKSNLEPITNLMERFFAVLNPSKVFAAAAAFTALAGSLVLMNMALPALLLASTLGLVATSTTGITVEGPEVPSMKVEVPKAEHTPMAKTENLLRRGFDNVSETMKRQTTDVVKELRGIRESVSNEAFQFTIGDGTRGRFAV